MGSPYEPIPDTKCQGSARRGDTAVGDGGRVLDLGHAEDALGAGARQPWAAHAGLIRVAPRVHGDDGTVTAPDGLHPRPPGRSAGEAALAEPPVAVAGLRPEVLGAVHEVRIVR